MPDRPPHPLQSPAAFRAALAVSGALALLAAAGAAAATSPAAARLCALLAAGAVAATAALAAVRVVLAQHRTTRDRFERHVARREAAVYANVEARLALDRLFGSDAVLPPMRGSVVSPDAAWWLYRFVLEHRPEIVVEFGSGVSTLVLAHAMERCGNGRVHSLDHEDAFARRTRALLETHGLAHRATVVHAPLIEHDVDGRRPRFYDTASLDDLPRIDAAFVDGPPRTVDPEVRHAALPLIWERLPPGGVVALDDADRPGERRIVERWRSAFPAADVRTLDMDKGLTIVRKPGPPGGGEGASS